jgi:hypothetical protein
MALLFQIEGATRLDDRVWKARLSPAEVRLLGPNAQVSGDTTVLLLSEGVKFDAARGHLAFDPTKAKLLNAGTSDSAILISSAGASAGVAAGKAALPHGVRGGDASFLGSLPSHLQELGTSLLRAVRSKYPGELKFFPKSGRYVDTPDNFWTVKPQPRAESFRITVRGTPDLFQDFKSLSPKPDQTGYSTFTIERASQIEVLVRLLGAVRRK